MLLHRRTTIEHSVDLKDPLHHFADHWPTPARRRAPGTASMSAVPAASVTRIAATEATTPAPSLASYGSGHYYWHTRIADNPARLAAFRAVFGDERIDYTSALRDHSHRGAPSNWRRQFVSAYAASHPLEDFAETWAHCLRLRDQARPDGRLSAPEIERKLVWVNARIAELASEIHERTLEEIQ